MDYLSTREAAAKWGVSLRYIQRLLHDGRIPGVQKYSGAWLIPANIGKSMLSRKSCSRRGAQKAACRPSAFQMIR